MIAETCIFLFHFSNHDEKRKALYSHNKRIYVHIYIEINSIVTLI